MDDDMEVIEEIKPPEKEPTNPMDIWGGTSCIFCKCNLVESLSDPKLLTCLHAACMNCVHEKSSNDNLTCDGCTQVCQLTEIIDHQFVIELKRGTNNNNESDKKNVTCACDDEAQVSSYCDDCRDWLCDECVSAHQRVRFTKDHVIKKKEDLEIADKDGQILSGQSRYLQCPSHKQELLKLYCESCEKLTCRDCQLVEHKDHKYQFLSAISDQYKLFLTTLLTKIKEKSSYIDSAQHLVTKRQSEILEREDEVTKEIKMFAVQIITLINQRGKQLLQELHDTCEKKKEQLVAKNEELVNLSLKLEHCLKFADSAVKESSDSALVYSKKLITNQLRHVLHKRCEVPNPQHIVDIRFMYDNKYLPEYINKVGQIVVDQQANSRTTNSRNSSLPNQATSSYQQPKPPFTYSRQSHIPNQSTSPQQRPSPPIGQVNYNSRPQMSQNANQVVNSGRAIPAQGYQQMNKPYTPRTPQNMDPTKVRQQMMNYTPIRPRMQHAQRAQPQQQQQQQQQNMPVQQSPTQRLQNSFQQHHDSGVRILNVQSLQSRNNRQQNSPQINKVNTTTPKVISVTSMSTNNQQQVRPNSNISLSMTNTQRLSHFPSQANNHSQDQSRVPPPRLPNSSINRMPSPVKVLELGRSNSDQQSKDVNINSNFNNKVPKSCSLTPVNNSSKVDDDDDVKIIEEKRMGLPDINSKAAEALRELHAYVEQSIGSINEQSIRPKKKESEPVTTKKDETLNNQPSKKDESSSLPVISNIVTLNENKGSPPVADNDSLVQSNLEGSRDGGADSRSDAASRDSGIDDVKQTQEFDPNEDWCAVCHDGGDLLCCSNCPRVYHHRCHVPAITKTPSDDWVCNMCKDISKYPFNGIKKRKNGLTVQEMNVCERILLELLCFEFSAAFHEPVSKEITDYHKIITNPMDLSSVRKRISEEIYDNVENYVNDMHLIFQNCYTYNRPESEYFASGKKTENFFLKLISKNFPNIKYQPAQAKVPSETQQTGELSPASSTDSAGGHRPKKRKNWAEDLVQLRADDSKEDD